MKDTVKIGRDRYFAQNSFGLDNYTSSKFPLYIWKWTIHLPSLSVLPLHDLHHVVTGYGTGFLGEAEISAYELRTGCTSLMVIILCVGAIFFGMFVAPRRILRAWNRAKGARSLYNTFIRYETLLEMSVTDLRKHLGIPHEGYQ